MRRKEIEKKKEECWGAKDAGAGAGRAPPSIAACQPARLTPCQPRFIFQGFFYIQMLKNASLQGSPAASQ